MCPHINTYFARLIPKNLIFDTIWNVIFIGNPRCSLLVLGKAYVLLLFSCSVLSSSLWPYEVQHISLPCPPLSPGVCSNSGPLNQWCHPTVSSSVVRFSPCHQSFPASRSFPASQFFTSGGQSIGASASASVLPTNIQGWFPLGLICLISLIYQSLFCVSNIVHLSSHWKAISFHLWWAYIVVIRFIALLKNFISNWFLYIVDQFSIYFISLLFVFVFLFLLLGLNYSFSIFLRLRSWFEVFLIFSYMH